MSDPEAVDKFWMVWRDQSPTTRYRHATRLQAVNEAERLAAANPGDIFYVLKSTVALVSEKPAIKRLKLKPDRIPF